MPYTFPNQRTITIHRERAASDFLGIKNENWMSAARDLGAHALLLYMYLASNANGYSLALSPTAVRQAVGMARSTYHDQFAKLIDRGYLVPSSGNSYDFYEVPQLRPVNIQNSVPSGGLNFDECPGGVGDVDPLVQRVLPEDTEINNTAIPTKPGINISGVRLENEIKVPEVKEITIPVPQRQGRKELTPKPEKTGFVF